MLAVKPTAQQNELHTDICPPHETGSSAAVRLDGGPRQIPARGIALGRISAGLRQAFPVASVWGSAAHNMNTGCLMRRGGAAGKPDWSSAIKRTSGNSARSMSAVPSPDEYTYHDHLECDADGFAVDRREAVRSSSRVGSSRSPLRRRGQAPPVLLPVLR